MRNVVSLLIFITIFFGYSTTIAQTKVVKYIEGTEYLKSNLYFKNSNRIVKTEYLKIIEGQIIYKKPYSQQEDTVSLTEVKMIRSHSGTHALEYGLYGGVIMALSALLGVADANADLESSGYQPVDGSPIVLVFTAVGAGTGALLGSLSDKWEVIYYAE